MNDFQELEQGSAAINAQGAAGTDDNLVLDLGGVDESIPKFEAMPPGTYDAFVESVESVISKSSGNPMLTFQFRVTTPEYENRLLFYHVVLNNPAGLGRLKRLLIAVYPDVDFAQFRPKAFAESGEALGKACRVKVTVRPYNGEKRNNVNEVLAPAAAGDSFVGAL